MEIVNTRDGYLFKIIGNKTFAILSGKDDTAFCPFCYGQINFTDDRCSFCHKNIPEIIYYHADDETWIASGNE